MRCRALCCQHTTTNQINRQINFHNGIWVLKEGNLCGTSAEDLHVVEEAGAAWRLGVVAAGLEGDTRVVTTYCLPVTACGELPCGSGKPPSPCLPCRLAVSLHVLGPVPGVDVMAKGHLRVGCSVRTTFPTTKITPAACHDSLHDRGSTTREDLGGGARGPGPAREWFLGLQCSARALAVPDSLQLRSK
jgi:hypothetical protein